jgi:hypothetical protein
MGELMATLLLIVDAWFELARDAAPSRFQPADRVEVLGLLVRLLARRFHGFRRVPRSEEVTPMLERKSVGLRVRSPGRVPSTEVVERQLAKYGFRVKRTGTTQREILVTCHDLAGAQVLAFPGDGHAHAHRTNSS